MISIYILLVLIVLFSILLSKLLNIRKNFLFCLILTLLLVLFTLNIETSLLAVQKGLTLCYSSIIPTILSFSIICNLLIAFDGLNIYSNLFGLLLSKIFRTSKNATFPLLVSFLCGYPLGAKLATDAFNSQLIDKSEYIRLLNLASNAGPIFIIGAIGTSLLNNTYYGYILLIGNYFSIILMSFILKPSKKFFSSSNQEKKIASPNIGAAIDLSIKDSIKTTLTVCGYVVFFSILISLIQELWLFKHIVHNIETFFSFPKDSLLGILLGSIELTNGANLITSSSLSIYIKLPILSFLCSFSGLSIVAQVSSFTYKHNISMMRYTFLKFLQGIFSFIITFFVSIIFIKTTTTSTICLNYNIFSYIFLVALFLSTPFIISKLFHSS